MSYKRYWVALAIVIIGSFAVLGGVGRKMISEAPPLPDVYSADGQLLFTGSSITDGQGVWQSIGGQEIGTVWGHGAYVAPDWSADWLHRESEILLNTWAVRDGASNFDALGLDQQAVIKARLIREMRTNTYDASRNRVTLSADRAAAFEQLRALLQRRFCDWPVRVRHSKRCIDQRSKAEATGRILLVDSVGLRNESPRLRDDLHQQLAA
jgi:nitric oxide reductase subunit B